MCLEVGGSAQFEPRWKASRMIDVIEERLEAIGELCRQYGVLRLDLFGSAATGAFDPATSDLDFVATFADTRSPGYADRYLGFAEALEALFHRPVDLLTEPMIRNPYFRQAVDTSRQLIYEERDSPAAA
jgi:predicted nucleotidyltransferase